MSDLIPEFAVIEEPSGPLVDSCGSREEADAAVVRHYAWKKHRREAAERNRQELDAGTAATNADWYDWEQGSLGSPIKDREWLVMEREVGPWCYVDKQLAEQIVGRYQDEAQAA